MKLIEVTKAFATEEQCSTPPPLPKSEVNVAIRSRRRL